MAVTGELTLVTDGYSPRNIGDAELVLASVEFAQVAYEDPQVALVALDREGFSRLVPDVVVYSRLFDRNLYSSLDPLHRFLLLTQWALFIVTETVTVFLHRRGWLKRSMRYAPAHMHETLSAYDRAARVVAVGGGYIGDRYLKESLLTCWTWWWCAATGKAVLTMPISVEARGRVFGIALSLLLRRVNVVVRDAASLETRPLRNHSLATMKPDLAFRNHRSIRDSSERRDVVLVAPVGGDYYEEKDWKQAWRLVADEVGENFSQSSVGIISMHEPLDGGLAGHDFEVAEFLTSLIPSSFHVKLDNSTYASLCDYMQAHGRLLISARMHAGIAGLCTGTPTILLGYEEKHRALMEDLGAPDLHCPLDRLTRSRLKTMISSASNPFALSQLDAVLRERSLALEKWALS